MGLRMSKEFWQGFMDKLAEEASFVKHPDTEQLMRITPNDDGTSTTNGPSGVAFMPGVTGTYMRDARKFIDPGKPVDVDPVEAVNSIREDTLLTGPFRWRDRSKPSGVGPSVPKIDPTLSAQSWLSFLGSGGKLNAAGTNLVNTAYSVKPTLTAFGEEPNRDAGSTLQADENGVEHEVPDYDWWVDVVAGAGPDRADALIDEGRHLDSLRVAEEEEQQ